MAVPEPAETSRFELDGMTPDRVVHPASLDELSQALAAAHDAGEAVVPWSGGIRIQAGNLPERYTTALDLTGLSGNIEHEPGDLTVVADAGVTIARLEETLALEGQRLPFDVNHPDRATLGGSVASNASGQIRTAYGGIRDWVIGMKVVLADGTITKSGGRVVKNVQGYDMHRLHTGAFGTLGVIAEVALKVVPVPAVTGTIAAWFDSVETAGEYAMQVYNGPALPEAMTLFAGAGASAALALITGTAPDGLPGAPVLVLSRVAGGAEAVARMETDLTGAAGAMGATGYEVVNGTDALKLWSAATGSGPDSGSAPITARATFKPANAFVYLGDTGLNHDSHGFAAEVQVGFGTVTVASSNATSSEITRLRTAAAKHGAQAVIERCPPELKKEIDVFGDSGTALELMKSVKRRFDPQRVLNPGRFAGRI